MITRGPARGRTRGLLIVAEHEVILADELDRAGIEFAAGSRSLEAVFGALIKIAGAVKLEDERRNRART